MTQVLTTSYFGNWSEVHFERNKSNWLESYPKTNHYSRRRSDPKIHSTSIPEITKKPLEEVQQILCDNPPIQSALKLGSNEHNLRTKRVIKKCITPEANQKITSYFADRKFSRPSIRSDKFISRLITSNESPRNCTSETISFMPEILDQSPKADDAENIANKTSTPNKASEPKTIAISARVDVPSWRTKIYPGKYIIEGTEDLSDKVFDERHLRHDLAEKKRKKRDEKCLEEQEKLGKLNRTSMSHFPKKKILHIEIIKGEPKCAFGYVIPDVPHEDFDLPPEFFTFRRFRQRKPSKTDSLESECSSSSSSKLQKLSKTLSVENSQ